ncbi:hypothetical protein ANANG_G00211060 [Anguilla anguilla]|uniref:C2H2-type domain-containing protein n=1 Tax=Anguilla anguilla TaxID=7936 RepID=A0A9D3RR78_ANGAN|nr:hypothetical protein ANANG_G00211060 [Anguilla anguilla]
MVTNGERVERQKKGTSLSEKNKARGKKKLAPERKEKVLKFLCRDEINRMLPGKKDTITKNKQKVQRRVLSHCLSELHSQCNAEVGGPHSLQCRQFVHYWPFYITEPKARDRNTCAFLDRENELRFCTTLSSSMMQAGVCLRQDTVTTLPELTEKHRIRLKEEELSGLGSVRMAESETVCAAPGLNTLEPQCVSVHSGVSDVHHTDTSLVKTETDLGSTHTGDLKVESLNSTELGYVTHLHPEEIKTETDDGGYLKAEHISDLQVVTCVSIESDQMKCESSERLVSDLMNTVNNGAHVEDKIQTEPWQCAADDLKGHLTMNSSEKQYICAKSIKRLDQLSFCIQNETVHTDKKAYKCTQCGKCFNYRSDFISHQRIHTGEKPYKCTQCGKCFRSTSNLNGHQKIHTGEKPYKCTQCGKCFRSTSNLNCHSKMHTGEKPYKCTQCGKCFHFQSLLNAHQRIHTGERPYICTRCGKGFHAKCQLNVHERAHTGERPYTCAQCGKSYINASNLWYHNKIHTGEKPYKCHQCGKRCSRSHELTRHLQTHTDEKTYKCTMCEKCFKNRSNFNSHQRIHTGEKPFKCAWCEQCFSDRVKLNIHQKIHTGENPHKCTHCGKCFHYQSRLNAHQRMHTGEKPYTCADCGKGFSKRYHLNTHQNIHTGEKPYKCTWCGKCFNNKSNLNTHQRLHTGEKARQSFTDS